MRAQTEEPLRLVGVRGLLILGGIVTAILFLMLFRPSSPSPFTSHGAFGAGYGRQSIMFGAGPRAGAPRLR
jgi:hypothetical protein